MPVKIAVLGGGSAGLMAVAHLARQFPRADIWHVFDPDIPTIGVGEGTTAGFRGWLEDVAPGSFPVFERACATTPKRGVQFENWGSGTEPFVHDFVPQDNSGLHLSAARLPKFFDERSSAVMVRRRVIGIRAESDGVTLELADAPELTVHFVVDARGFPRTLGHEHISFWWIPTNAAVVTRGGATSGLERTRAVARPHGWIFVIPLSDSTGYGYVYGEETASAEEVQDDFGAFLFSEDVHPTTTPRTIRFPNFVCREVFDGRVCKLGNAAAFIEPLEATAIAIIKTELTMLTEWLRVAEGDATPRMARELVSRVNASLRQIATEVSLFVAWHYSAGSAFDTPFWKKARQGFQRGLESGVPTEVRALFEAHLRRAADFPADEVRSAQTRSELDRLLRGRAALPHPFGGMTSLGFAQVAQGLAGSRHCSPP